MAELSLSALPPAARRCLTLALLVVVTTGGCRPDPAAVIEQQRKSQENAATSLQELGAKMERKEYRQGKAWSIDLSGIQLPSDIIERLKKLDHVSELNLSKTNITDAQMASLKEPALSGTFLKLDLSDTAISDAGLDQLDGLFFLSELNLKGTQVTQAGVQRFLEKRASNTKIRKMFKSPKIKR